MDYYIVDTTLKPAQNMRFGTYPEAVAYMGTMTKRAYGQDRKERMLVLEEIGHGPDDRDAVNFVRSMSDTFDIGVIRDGRKMRCDITTIALFQKKEFGD